MPATILIADDYDDARELLRLMLEAAGYRVREARDGGECLRMAQADVPDLVMMDISMPVLNGWSVLRELRRDERTREVPCAAITAFAGTDNHRRALQAGFDAYLSKPYHTPQLLDTVKSLLDARRRRLLNSPLP